MIVTRRNFIGTCGQSLAAGALLASAGSCSRSEPVPASTARGFEARVAALEARIAQSMRTHRVPGVSVAIVRDARIAWTKGFGVRDRSTGAPVEVDTVFSAQSMSKPVFAYRVMKLVERGVLDLDAPLTRYTSDVFVKNEPRLDRITARRVLSHTTGLPNWRGIDDPLRLAFDPGSKWQYSGEGYHYLQSVVTRLTGHVDADDCGEFDLGYRVCATDFEDDIDIHLFRPFGMSHSWYVATPDRERTLARPHDAAGAPMPPTRNTRRDVARYGSAGSLMTTASDFATFLIEVMQPKPADASRLREDTRTLMLTPQIDASSEIKRSWALGWQIWHLEHGDVVAHGGDFDGWHSQSMFSPARKSGFVILTNGEGGAPLIWNNLLTTLLDDFVLA